MNLLAIDTSTDTCSVAASRGAALFSRSEPALQRQAETVLGLVEDLLAEAQLELGQIEGIAYGEGPGSFTGLRIAAGVTQGLAFARGLSVVGVGSLLSLAEDSAGEKVIACIDAHMGEVYHAAYRRAGSGWTEVSRPGLYRPEAVPLVAGGDWLGCGDGFAAHRERLASRLGDSVSEIRSDATPSARAVLKLAIPRFAAGEAKDAATAVPVYLRDKVARKTGERE
ncbi:MAG TPA: tRNA (adenosine(37)-N6)-threonylcarbamoyltransferase complex dimerization subunit type 1 TsaB [Burkholderiales bacterium]|nr:tRNA (adenosine(37)-N6)-threonylcarbamoyltransferase complex dimerization subunit type 1 TsaB [Burkholderiales bacterium]